MPSRDAKDLHPLILDKYHAFLFKCKEAQINILITCTYRSSAEQNELYAQGRSKNGHIVTNARGGESKHNFEINGTPASKAFDIAIIGSSGLLWDTKDPKWTKVVQIGRDVGLHPGADFKSIRDFPHFEID